MLYEASMGTALGWQMRLGGRTSTLGFRFLRLLPLSSSYVNWKMKPTFYDVKTLARGKWILFNIVHSSVFGVVYTW